MNLQAINGLFKRSEFQRCDCEPHPGEWNNPRQRCEARKTQVPGLSEPLKIPVISPQVRHQLQNRHDLPVAARGRARKTTQGNYPDMVSRPEKREPPSKHRNFYYSLTE